MARSFNIPDGTNNLNAANIIYIRRPLPGYSVCNQNNLCSPDITFALGYKAGKFMRLVRDINFVLQVFKASRQEICRTPE